MKELNKNQKLEKEIPSPIKNNKSGLKEPSFIAKDKQILVDISPLEIQEGETCVLKQVKHGDHVDYVHDGHTHRIHGKQKDF